MKIKFLLFILFIINNCYGQHTFQKIIQAANYLDGYSIQQTSDGGYIITGGVTFYFNNTSGSNLCLIKTNSDGDTLWSKTYASSSGAYPGEYNSTGGSAVQQTYDSGYIITGNSQLNNQPTTLYVVKTNAIGDLLWSQSYSDTNLTEEHGSSIQQTNDSGYIISGTKAGLNTGSYDVYLLKINASGDIAWSKTYGGTSLDEGHCAKQTSDSGYIICGYTGSFGAGAYNIYLIKTNSKGDTLWTKTYGGALNNQANSVQQTTDGGYIITGFTTSFGAGGEDIYLIKTDAQGDTLWTKTYGGANNDYAYEVQQTNDDGYIIGGFTDSFGGGRKAYLIKTNADGDTLWTKIYGGDHSAQCHSVSQTTDSGYIILANLQNVNSKDAIYLIKTDAKGNSGCYEGTNSIVASAAIQVASTATIVDSGGTVGIYPAYVQNIKATDTTVCLSVGINEQKVNNSIYIFPNPTNDQMVITGDWKVSGTLTLTIENVLGELIYKKALKQNRETINCEHFQAGLYFVRIANEKELWVGKFVKE